MLRLAGRHFPGVYAMAAIDDVRGPGVASLKIKKPHPSSVKPRAAAETSWPSRSAGAFVTSDLKVK